MDPNLIQGSTLYIGSSVESVPSTFALRIIKFPWSQVIKYCTGTYWFRGPWIPVPIYTHAIRHYEWGGRFPEDYQCIHTWGKPRIKCLTQLFVLCGMPAYIHSERGSALVEWNKSTKMAMLSWTSSSQEIRATNESRTSGWWGGASTLVHAKRDIHTFGIVMTGKLRYRWDTWLLLVKW